MIHLCRGCMQNFQCNGGRGTPCSCGQYMSPAALRRCPMCKREQERIDVQNRMDAIAAGEQVYFQVAGNNGEVFQVPPPVPPKAEYITVKEGELCRCNKCSAKHPRVRLVP